MKMHISITFLLSVAWTFHFSVGDNYYICFLLSLPTMFFLFVYKKFVSLCLWNLFTHLSRCLLKESQFDYYSSFLFFWFVNFCLVYAENIRVFQGTQVRCDHVVVNELRFRVVGWVVLVYSSAVCYVCHIIVTIA